MDKTNEKQPELLICGRLPECSHSIGLGTGAQVEARVVDLNAHHLTKELLESAIGEVEDVSPAHA